MAVVVVRGAVVLVLASLAGLVLWCTPLPKLQYASCLRPCHELDWPMICRVKVVLDMSTVISREQTVCPHNLTGCDVGGCVLSGGVRTKILTANGQLPGPTIQACEKDILVVDVVNRVPGTAVTVHWRGQSQRETPYMDGAAMVTQCPINSFTTFQYKFRATNPGTHLWQVQTGNDGLDALFGALIVRQSAKKDPHHELYDDDDYFILISELPTADVNVGTVPLLINGQPSGQSVQEALTYLNVTAYRRHRLRIAYAVTSLSCPISVAVDRHSLLIIAIDGHPIRPIEVQSIRLAPGERVDAVLTADQEVGDYVLTARTGDNCPKRALGSALLTYQTDQSTHSSLTKLPPHHANHLKGLSTVGDGKCSRGGDTDLVCLPKIESLTKLPPELSADKLDFTLYLPFDFVKPSPRSVFDDATIVPRFNNLTLMFPSSPLLSQLGSVEPETVCNAASRPALCENTAICECVHIIDIPLHAAVELVLIDQASVGEHVFHLHGNSFHVVGAASSVGHRGVEAVKDLDHRGLLFPRNLKNPVVKDTVSVPAGGVVAVRFKADNPGYWMLHDERPSYWSQGLGVILHVGGIDDVPPVPENFPTCGSWGRIPQQFIAASVCECPVVIRPAGSWGPLSPDDEISLQISKRRESTNNFTNYGKRPQ